MYYQTNRNQIQMESNQHFYDKTDIFSIDASFKEGRLKIILRDFVEWAIYERQYTEEDVGKEVHRKADLSDVFGSFSHIQGTKPDEKLQRFVGEVTRLKHYEFGSIIQFKVMPCYKVKKGGRITSYLTLIDKKFSRQFVCQSEFTLVKVRGFTDTQIQAQKSNFEKNSVFEKLLKKLQNQIDQKETLSCKIKLAQIQNRKTKEQLKLAKMVLSSKVEKPVSEFEQVRQQAAITAIEQAIEDTGQMQGHQLFEEIASNLKKVQIKLQDILKFSISEAQAKKLTFPIKVYIPKPVLSVSPSQIKKALLGALMYPLELIYPNSNLLNAQNYSNVIDQQSICVELKHPLTIQAIRAVIFYMCSVDRDHQYLQILNKHQQSIKNLSDYQIFYLPRQNGDICWKGELANVDPVGRPNQFLDMLCQMRNQLRDVDEYLIQEDEEEMDQESVEIRGYSEK